MANHSKHNPVTGYIMVALILGVITYLEFAMVEYPQAWLGSTWTLVLLIALSIAKFIMVIMFFMHLKEDDKTYTGFFGSGMFIALGTFIAMAAMFVLPRAVAVTRPPADSGAVHASSNGGGHGSAELPHELVDLIASDGRSRSAADAADTPRVVDRTVAIVAPSATNDASTYEVGEAAGITAAVAATPAPAPETAPTEAQTETPATAEAPEVSAQAPESPAEEPAAQEPAAQEPEAVAWNEELGQQVYLSNCMACHQANGQGIPGAFPPLAQHAADLYAADGGEYLSHVLLFGVQGQISVQGMNYNGFMPAWPQLSDEQLASVLNHIVVKLGPAPAGFVPYQAADVAAERTAGLNAVAVYEARGALSLP